MIFEVNCLQKVDLGIELLNRNDSSTKRFIKKCQKVKFEMSPHLWLCHDFVLLTWTAKYARKTEASLRMVGGNKAVQGAQHEGTGARDGHWNPFEKTRKITISSENQKQI